LGFLYFFVLSIGLGSPLAVLAVFSGSLKRLPLSGEWMVWVKKAFGWVLIAMAGYVLWPFIPSSEGRLFIMVGIMFLAGMHLGWLDKSASKWHLFPILKKAISAVMILCAVVFGLMALRPVGGIQWEPYDEAALRDAARKKAVVMLDFYAEWCGPCKALDRKVFTDPQVVDLSERFVRLRADLTTRHEEQERLQRRFEIRGVPTVIFINRDGKEERELRIESYVKPSVLLERMKKTLTSAS
jgi:thiol:disulfide interchange protein DsbD